MLICTSLTNFYLILWTCAVTVYRTRSVQQTTEWIIYAYRKGRRVARDFKVCHKTELYLPMPRRIQVKAVKLTLDLQNTAKLRVLLRKRVLGRIRLAKSDK